MVGKIHTYFTKESKLRLKYASDIIFFAKKKVKDYFTHYIFNKTLFLPSSVNDEMCLLFIHSTDNHFSSVANIVLKMKSIYNISYLVRLYIPTLSKLQINLSFPK